MPRLPALFAAPRWRWLAPVLALVLLFHFSGLGRVLDRAFLDGATRRPWRAVPVDPSTSAIVLIDERTLEHAKEQGYGSRWPFPRFAFAGLIAALHRAGAEKIVMDFTFRDPSDAVEQDTLLAGVATVASGTILARTPGNPPVFWDDEFQQAHARYFTSPRMGNVAFTAESDGVARRYSLDGSLAAAAAGSDAAGIELLRWAGGLEHLKARGVPVLSAAPYFADGLALTGRLVEAAMDYAAAAEAETEPQLDLDQLATALEAEPRRTDPAAAAVAGRTVFVGASAAGTFDVKSFPVGTLEPGVLLHWTAWQNLRHTGFHHEVPRIWSLALAAVGIAALAAIGVAHGRLLRLGCYAALFALGTLLAAYLGFGYGIFFAPATPIAAALLGFTGVAAEGLWAEHQRRREIQTMFGSYVDHAVVDRLVRDPNAIRLGGERRVATVFFCDLAGFTDLSEQVSPERLVDLINRYLQDTSDCLREYGAYIDKYIGDAVMAVFGAPQDQPDHAVAAGRAALAAQRALARLNQELAAEFGRTLHMRIGLNTGEMIVGNVGSSQKRNYTVLGDAVNLAARLEGANKEFGTSILVGETTACAIGEQLALRPVARLRVKGKQTAVQVSELWGEYPSLTAAEREFLACYRAGYRLFAERQFAAAETQFAQALDHKPDDRLSRTARAEAQRLTQCPPPADWEPTISLSSK